MTKQELINQISPYGYPQMVLTRNLRSFIGAEISDVTKGSYNHFCWLINKDEIASQDLLFKIVPIDSYLEGIHIVKFVTDTRWTDLIRIRIYQLIKEELALKWYEKRYDVLAILGQWTGWKWLQSPFADICSDKAKYLRGIDPDYNIKHPSPTDINNYQKLHQKTVDKEGYFVTARWLPEDI